MHFILLLSYRGNGGSKLSSFSKVDEQRSDTYGLELRHDLQGLAPILCSVSL